MRSNAQKFQNGINVQRKRKTRLNAIFAKNNSFCFPLLGNFTYICTCQPINIMNTTKINLSQVVVNKANPRTISDTKFSKLVDSILNFPKMLELRPIVIDETHTALGGNMRLRALNAIAGMSQADISARLDASRDFQTKTQPEKDALLTYWETWKIEPTAIVTYASELTDTEKRSFIIKDNASFGSWDWDALANEWDAKVRTTKWN